MKSVLAAIVIAVTVSTGAAARQQPAPSPAAPAPAPGSAAKPVAPAPQAQPAPAPAEPVQVGPALLGSDQPNIRFDVAITDDGAGAPAVRKNLVIMVQGNGKASLRSQGRAPVAGNPNNVFLNVDVTVAGWGVSEPNKVRARVLVEYQPYLADVPMLPASVRAQVDVHLENGKKLQIWQTADPVSDRHTSIEVTATVLK